MTDFPITLRAVARAGARGPTSGAKGGAWFRRAMAVAAMIDSGALHDGALQEIRRAAAAGERVAVAVSGGADSVALLLALWSHVPDLRGRWLILHFDHALRGRESAGDARFVLSIARGLGEACAVGRWDRSDSDRRAGALRHAATAAGRALKDGMAQSASPTIERAEIEPPATSESEAREARFAFFARAMRETAARVLALGHQADDVIETMLMRLVRGSATAGLAAPRPVHRRADGSVRVRPLLELTGGRIREVLRSAGVPWREDASNAGEDFFRNRIRQRVVPGLRASARRDLARGFLDARRTLEEDDDALNVWLGELSRLDPGSGLAVVRARPRALVRRAVHEWLLQTEGLTSALSRAAVDALIDAVAAGRTTRQSAGKGRFIVFDGRTLKVESASSETGQVVPGGGWGDDVRLQVNNGSLENAQGDRLSAKLVRLTPKTRRAILSGRYSPATTVFLATVARSFSVRCRRAGDRYRPIGAPGSARLQDLLINRKIPRVWRDRLPVVCDGQGEPVWVPGFAPASALAVGQRTKLVVQLTYQPAAPILPPP